jgi:hypothetical protein
LVRSIEALTRSKAGFLWRWLLNDFSDFPLYKHFAE